MSLTFKDVFDGLLTRRMCEMNPRDSVISGYAHQAHSSSRKSVFFSWGQLFLTATLFFFAFCQSPMLDFGKIIIYTSNLRIIRAPPRKPEELRHRSPSPADREGFPRARERGSRRRARARDGEEKRSSDAETKVMILGQIIPSGVLEGFFFFSSPAVTFLLLRPQPAFLSPPFVVLFPLSRMARAAASS